MGANIEKTLNEKIGGYKLPADFKCLSLDFLKSLTDLSFQERIVSIYQFVLNKTIPETFFESIDLAEYPANVYGVDDEISVLELFDGNTLTFLDYAFGNSLEEKVSSLAFAIVSAYVDLCDSKIVNFGEKINIVADASNGIIALSLEFAKRIKLPIETLILGVDKLCDSTLKGVYFNASLDGEVEEIISMFYDETDYLLDPVSANGLVAYDYFYSDYEDDKISLLIALNSPYLFARSLLKTITGINEISVDKAIKKLCEFTAIEVPSSIENGGVQPFYKKNNEILVKDALEIIKG